MELCKGKEQGCGMNNIKQVSIVLQFFICAMQMNGILHTPLEKRMENSLRLAL